MSVGTAQQVRRDVGVCGTYGLRIEVVEVKNSLGVSWGVQMRVRIGDSPEVPVIHKTTTREFQSRTAALMAADNLKAETTLLAFHKTRSVVQWSAGNT